MGFMYYANQNIATYGSRGMVDNAAFYISFRMWSYIARKKHGRE